MEDVIDRLYKMITEEYFYRVCSENYCFDFNDNNIAILLQSRNEIFEEHFSFLRPYLDTDEFYESLDYFGQNNSLLLITLKLFVCDDAFYRALKVAKNRDERIVEQLFLVDEKDVDTLLELGYSLENVIEMNSTSRAIKRIYELNGKLSVDLFASYHDGLGEIVASEYAKGNKRFFINYVNPKNTIGFVPDIEAKIREILIYLADYHIDLPQLLIDIKFYANIYIFSLIEDVKAIRKMVNNWGTEAIIFAKKIVPEIIDLVPEYSFDNYKELNGCIKESPDILLNLLVRGYKEALFYAEPQAIDERVMNFVRTNNYSLDDIKKSYVSGSYLMAKYLAEMDELDAPFHVKDGLTNIDAFNYLYEYFLKFDNDIDTPSYSLDSIRVIRAFAIKKFDLQNIDSLEVSSEVARRMIELGFDFTQYFNIFSFLEGFDQLFYEQGEKGIFFVTKNEHFVISHIDEIDYDSYFQFKERFKDTYKKANPARPIVVKFLKQGHYDIILRKSVLRFISPYTARYPEIVVYILREYPESIKYPIVKPYITQELFEIINETVNDAFLYLPKKLQTTKNYMLIKNKKAIDYSKLSREVLIKIVSEGALEKEHLSIVINVFLNLLEDPSLIVANLNNYIKNSISRVLLQETDSVVFKKMLGLGEAFDYSILGQELAEAFRNAHSIINSTGKVNTISQNPVFSFKTCMYIYPLFGLNFTINLIKYNTLVSDIIIDEIISGNSDLLVRYYNFIVENRILNNGDKLIHLAIRAYPKIKKLFTDLVNHKDELTNSDLYNISKIILNMNYYEINSFEDLKRYDIIVKGKIKDLLVKDDIDAIKEYISRLFDCTFEELKQKYENYQIGNMSKIASVRNMIKSKLGAEEFNRKWPEMFYTKEELGVVLLIERIIYSNDIDEIKEIIRIHLDAEEKGIDYSSDLKRIIEKIRKIYTLQFNLYLSDPSKLEGDRLEKDDPNNKYNVTIIDLDGEEFFFLSHCLHGFDPSHFDFVKMIKNDPSLWTKLEGAITLSTSCFSDKGFWFFDGYSSDNVIYLFSNLPEDFILFMYGGDLSIQHGGYVMEPTAYYNSFSDIQALVQSSNYHNDDHNEVAGFRAGMIPSAIACMSTEPKEEQIRAAKYFSKFTGKDVPIIRFNIAAYNKKKSEDYLENKKRYVTKVDINLIEPIILNGVDRNIEDLVNNIKFCFDKAKDEYQNGILSYFDFYLIMSRIIRTVNRLDNSFDVIQKEMMKITFYRNSLLVSVGMSRETVRQLNEVEMRKLENRDDMSQSMVTISA